MGFLAQVGLWIAVFASAAGRPPWLADASSTTATVCWGQTAKEARCRLEAGLLPGSTFAYAIPGSSETFVGRTLPTTGGVLRFVAFGDSGDGSKAQHRVARLIERLDPQAILHLGDVVYRRGADKDYTEKYFEPYRRILPRIAVFPSIGNHDYGNRKRKRAKGDKRFRKVYERIYRRPRYYAFSAGDVRFFSLDTNEAYGVSAAAPIGPTSEQVRWLDRELGASKAVWKIVLMHVPLYSSWKHGDHRRLREAIEPVLRRHGVDLVLAGHNHIYERRGPLGGIVHLTVGTGGKSLRWIHWPDRTVEKRVRAYGVVLGIADGRRLTLEFHDDQGEVRDRVVLEKVTVQPQSRENRHHHGGHRGPDRESTERKR